MDKALVIGNVYENIKCESFKDKRTGRIRVRPLPGQGFPTNLFIECSSTERNAHVTGTKFRTENVKICAKPNGRIYLRAKDHMIYKIL